MEKLSLSDLPRLNGDSVILSSTHLAKIFECVNAQAQAIEDLTNTVNSFISRMNVQDVKIVELRNNIKTLANSIQTLGGSNDD